MGATPLLIELRVLIRYSLLQVFSKFGKVTKMDFLFHKTGALKGKPRGYAFVEYADKNVRSLPMPIFSRLVAHPGFLSHCTQRIEHHTTVPYRLTAKVTRGGDSLTMTSHNHNLVELTLRSSYVNRRL